MKFWDIFLVQQEAELGLETVAKWLRPLKILRYDACNLYLEAKDSFQIMWFEEHVRSKIITKFVNNNNKRIKVHLSLAKVNLPKHLKLKKNNDPPAQNSKFLLAFDELDPYCTLEYFIPTEGNLLPYKLLCKVAGFDPEKGYSKKNGSELSDFNPIYLHGSSGTGKTHLLMALAHALTKQGLNVLYARAETFTHHVVSAIRAGEMNIFRQTYRNSDVLILDDVHVFSRKGATQEELFHTFNTLHLAGKQIILSAHCTPSELQMIEPRLVSRFEWGIALALEQLPLDATATMLANKAQTFNFPLHPKVAEFLLQTFSRGTKAVNKALQALILRCHMAEASEGVLSKQLTVPQTRYLLKDLILEEEQLLLTPEKVIQSVAEHFGIRSDDILGKAQTRDFVLPRQFAMYFCRHLLKIPYMKIGALFSKDHSTVMSSVKIIQKGIDRDDVDIRGVFNLLEKKLK
jgi:chromosomal replication initiator protein